MLEQRAECNYIVVGLVNDYVHSFASLLAEKLDYYFLEVEKLINYNIANRIEMENICGKEYLEREELKVISSLNDYERTVAILNESTFVKHKEKFKNFNIIYLQFDYKTVVKCEKKHTPNFKLKEIVFAEMDNFLKKNCNFIINCDILNFENKIEMFLKGL